MAERHNTKRERKTNRLNYPLLFRELKAKHQPGLDEAKKAWKDAKFARADPEEVQRLRQEYFDKRKEFQHQRLAIKSQCRALRNCRVKKPVIDLSDGNPWDTRLTDMHNFFGTKDKNQQKSIEQRFASLSSPSLIPSLIDEILGDGESFSHTINVGAMEGIVRGIVASGMFEEMLKYIISSPDVLGEVASLSDHHDLFDKTVLFKGKSGWKLRLHKFTPETFVDAQEEVHSHRNHFVSYCIHGGLTQQIWEESKHVKNITNKARLVSQRTVESNEKAEESNGEEGEVNHTMYKYIYDPIVAKPEDIIEEEEEEDEEEENEDENGVKEEKKKEGGRVFNLHECGKVDLTCVGEASANPGETYYMHPSVLHSVNGIKGGTITLVLNSKQAVSKSAFATLEPWENTCFVRQQFTSEEMAELLNKVLDIVAGGE